MAGMAVCTPRRERSAKGRQAIQRTKNRIGAMTEGSVWSIPPGRPIRGASAPATGQSSHPPQFRSPARSGERKARARIRALKFPQRTTTIDHLTAVGPLQVRRVHL